MIQPGDLVSCRDRYTKKVRLCVALRVTADDIRDGMNAPRPGIWLFRGYWYGTDPLSHKSYGKIEGNRGFVRGQLHTHQQAVQLLR